MARKEARNRALVQTSRLPFIKVNACPLPSSFQKYARPALTTGQLEHSANKALTGAQIALSFAHEQFR
jgi:hypothetical protein